MSVKGKIKDWSQKKIRGDGLEAALAEAAERKLDLSGHVGIDVPFKEYVDSLYPLLNNGRRIYWHPHNEIIADVLEDARPPSRDQSPVMSHEDSDPGILNRHVQTADCKLEH